MQHVKCGKALTFNVCYPNRKADILQRLIINEMSQVIQKYKHFIIYAIEYTDKINNLPPTQGKY